MLILRNMVSVNSSIMGSLLDLTDRKSDIIVVDPRGVQYFVIALTCSIAGPLSSPVE